MVGPAALVEAHQRTRCGARCVGELLGLAAAGSDRFPACRLLLTGRVGDGEREGRHAQGVADLRRGWCAPSAAPWARPARPATARRRRPACGLGRCDAGRAAPRRRRASRRWPSWPSWPSWPTIAVPASSPSSTAARTVELGPAEVRTAGPRTGRTPPPVPARRATACGCLPASRADDGQQPCGAAAREHELAVVVVAGAGPQPPPSELGVARGVVVRGLGRRPGRACRAGQRSCAGRARPSRCRRRARRRG